MQVEPFEQAFALLKERPGAAVEKDPLIVAVARQGHRAVPGRRHWQGRTRLQLGHIYGVHH